MPRLSQRAQGIARETEFVLQPAAQPGYMETNQEVVTYLSSLERDGTSFILLKPTEAVPHGGGLVLSEGSAEYNMLAQFAESAREPVVCDTEPTVTTDPLAGVTMMSYPRTLQRRCWRSADACRPLTSSTPWTGSARRASSSC